MAKDFRTVQEHFRKLRCSHCQKAFTPEGVALVREESDYWVVRVTCTSCKQPAGVAIVGIEYEGGEGKTLAEAEQAVGGTVEPQKQRSTFRDATFSSISERKRFAEMKKIGVNDVLDAVNFIRAMDSSWMKHIPAKFRKKF